MRLVPKTMAEEMTIIRTHLNYCCSLEKQSYNSCNLCHSSRTAMMFSRSPPRTR